MAGDGIIFSRRYETFVNSFVRCAGKIFAKLSVFVFQRAGPEPTFLQFLRVKTLTNADCRSRHVLPLSKFVDAATLCAMSRKNQGACLLDSGSPLVANGQLIGVVSWVKYCALGVPDGYARISSFVDWIQEVSGVVAV